MIGISIWEIDTGDRQSYNGISVGISIWDMGYRYGILYHIDMVILDIDVGYGLMMWEITVSIWSS